MSALKSLIGQIQKRKSYSWLLAFFLVSLYAKASDPAEEFRNANALYQRQNYDSAAQIYEHLVSQEYRSAEIYYNLANCYYKQDRTSKAVLNYERALKIQPDDEDIAFNLKVAQLKVVDKIEAVPDIFYKRWVKSIAAVFTTDGWSRFVILCIWIMFLFAAVYIMSARIVMRRTGFMLASFFLIISLCAWLITQQSFNDHVLQRSAVVMSVSAYVKSSPGDKNTDLFLLHEGTTMDILDEYDNWVKIRIANGSIGWLKSADIEEI